ncbi:hypothetical protein GFK82_00771 [Candidatus Steffania adelgidicola]|nr:hypothetical protein GFK82_00771 [Candidatus Steffania adelgidicola]
MLYQFEIDISLEVVFRRTFMRLVVLAYYAVRVLDILVKYRIVVYMKIIFFEDKSISTLGKSNINFG